MALLFKTTEEIKAYCGALAPSTDMSLMTGAIELATYDFIRPVLGDAQLDALLAAYHSVGSMPSALADLLQKVQLPLANFVMANLIQSLLLTVGNAGSIEPQMEHVTPARQWVVNQNVRLYESAAWRGVEMLLAHLERYQSDYELWRNSQSYTERHELTIKNTEQLGRYVGLNASRRAYLAIRPFIERAEELHLQPLLGTDLYQAYKEALATGSPSQAITTLREKAAPVVAHAAMCEALPESVFVLTDDGIRVLAGTDLSAQSNSGDSQQMANRIAHHTSLLKRFGVALFQYLEAHAENYPQYVSTAQTSRIPLPEQDTSSSTFLL